MAGQALTPNIKSGINVKEKIVSFANEYSKLVGINYGSITLEFQKGEVKYTSLNIREQA